MTRRGLLRRAGASVVAGLAAPLVTTVALRGETAPSNRITLGCIGTGRMGTDDMRSFLGFPGVQVLAVCDVDAHRRDYAKQTVDRYYSQRGQGGPAGGCDQTGDFREIIARADIDAVSVVTPDHWHAIPSIAALRAGKDVFVQKPMTLSIPEGRALADAAAQYGRVVQVGSQQRSDVKFRLACELVRNGCIGTLRTIKIGVGSDIFTAPVAPTAPPAWLDYDMWLGPAPKVPYIEQRIMPASGYGRPGWLRTRDYTCGMITAWGTHHMDIAHWGMGTEHTGPVEVSASAEFAKEGPWDVHGKFRVDYMYANGVKVNFTDNSVNAQGVRFEGDEGWVYVRRGFIDASPKSLLRKRFGAADVRLYQSNNHKGNFLECIRSRRDPIAPAEIGHRSNSACVMAYIAMLAGRTLKWDPATECFVGDDEANRMLDRPLRSPWRL